MIQKPPHFRQMDDSNSLNMLLRPSTRLDLRSVWALSYSGIVTGQGVVLVTEKHEASLLL